MGLLSTLFGLVAAGAIEQNADRIEPCSACGRTPRVSVDIDTKRGPSLHVECNQAPCAFRRDNTTTVRFAERSRP